MRKAAFLFAAAILAAPAMAQHEGHEMPAVNPVPLAASGEHSGHVGHPDATNADPPVASPPAAATSGPAHAADTVYESSVMASARDQARKEHGSMQLSKFLLDRLETRIHDGKEGYAWDAQFWTGSDLDKLWLKSEGEGSFGETAERAEVQALWSHAIDPWFDLQLGLRHDFRPDPDRTHIVAGVRGLAPYWFELDGALFLSDKGDLTATAEAEYDFRIRAQLILQPRVELRFSAQDVPELDLGSGLTDAAAGVRLRYEINPRFAPYLGVERKRTFGDTRRFAKAAGEDSGGWSFLIGIKTWF